MLSSTGVLITTFLNIATANAASPPPGLPLLGGEQKRDKPTFKAFVEKYDASTVWERLDQLKMTKKTNLTMDEEIDFMFKGMDPTDELLRLKVVNGNATVPVKQGRRSFVPNEAEADREGDKYQTIRRLNELMKQVIYQTRNKMIIMQTIREDYKHTGLYKMGFLISRVDFRSRLYASFAYKALQHCSLKRQDNKNQFTRLYAMDIAYTIERSLQMWFELDLLHEYLEKNHLKAKNIVSKFFKAKREKLTDAFVY